jgi:hypothetical protein
MVINNILICGSTFLTKAVTDVIKHHYNIVGYIPTNNSPFTTSLDYPIVDFNIDYDIILSIQYDKKVSIYENSYNVHTGLLPEWGGCDIIYHTLKSKANEQGLTFHQMSKNFDEGSIISKITYPIFSNDTMENLYDRNIRITPYFVLNSLKLLETLPNELEIPLLKPKLYKRGEILTKDLKEYKNFPKKIKNKYG